MFETRSDGGTAAGGAPVHEGVPPLLLVLLPPLEPPLLLPEELVLLPPSSPLLLPPPSSPPLLLELVLPEVLLPVDPPLLLLPPLVLPLPPPLPLLLVDSLGGVGAELLQPKWPSSVAPVSATRATFSFLCTTFSSRRASLRRALARARRNRCATSPRDSIKR
jgi:hypothetical protein